MRIGIDITEVERFKNWGPDKLAKIFTKREMEYLQSQKMALDSIAGLFCAKEAFFKAIGTGISMSQMLDIEILHDNKGAPYIKLLPTLARQSFTAWQNDNSTSAISESKYRTNLVAGRHLGTSKIHLSISHTKVLAVAVCIIVHLDEIRSTF